MANGQAVMRSAVLDTAAADRLCIELEAGEISRHAAHAAQLRRALELDRVYRDAGMGLQTTAELALLWRCSENAASTRLHQAEILDRLGALAAMHAGLLTVEQGRVVVDILGSVPAETAAPVWDRLHRRLEQDALIGAVLPPARTAELLRRWLIEADPHGAVDRRNEAERHTADVDLWRREDGLVDIAIRGVTGPNAQACGQRIRDHADPIGLGDDRPVGVRLRDAAVDLILGRTTLPFPTGAGGDAAGESTGRGCGRLGCGCTQARPVPCGANIQVLVPLTGALGTSDATAELVGHGPLEPDLLAQLLLSAPVLTRVWVDPDTGVPVAVEDRTWTPGRGDPDSLRAALLDIATGDPPGDLVPQHPDDHPPPAGHPHPADTPGPYVVPRRLRRLLTARSPRCEWPGCGRRAVTRHAGCDIDHDLAWPDGPTCGCNNGPACRRHHRIKQLGWLKQRRPGGHVRWTSPLGRQWLSRSQHQPPPPPVRPLPPVTHPDPLEGLSDRAFVALLWQLDPENPIFDRYDTRDTFTVPDDTVPIEGDVIAERYAHGDLWTRLDDDGAWHHYPDPQDEPLGP